MAKLFKNGKCIQPVYHFSYIVTGSLYAASLFQRKNCLVFCVGPIEFITVVMSVLTDHSRQFECLN